MKLVIVETALVYLTICELHDAFVALVIAPDTLVIRSIVYPGHSAFTVTFASFELSLIFGFFVLAASWVGKAIVVLHIAKTVWSSILKGSLEPVTVLVVYLAQVIESSVTESAWLYNLFSLLFCSHTATAQGWIPTVLHGSHVLS